MAGVSTLITGTVGLASMTLRYMAFCPENCSSLIWHHTAPKPYEMHCLKTTYDKVKYHGSHNMSYMTPAYHIPENTQIFEVHWSNLEYKHKARSSGYKTLLWKVKVLMSRFVENRLQELIAVEGTHPCTSLGLMLLITGTVARPFMTQRSASTILEIPIFGQRQTQKAYMQYYLNMIASASNNLWLEVDYFYFSLTWRGVRVNLLMQWTTCLPLLKWFTGDE